MITHVKGSLLESPAKVLVNTVNTAGVMGKGIAKTFKSIYPDMFTQYQELCENQTIDIGKLWVYKTNNKWILNFPTKKHWRSPSKAEYIEAGLKKFKKGYAQFGITSVAFPRLGCGHGELDWHKQVEPLMEAYLTDLPIDVFIYTFPADKTVPEHRQIKDIKKWLRNEPRSLGFIEVWDDLKNIVQETNKSWVLTDGTKYNISLTSNPEEGLRINIDPGEVRDSIIGKIMNIFSRSREPSVIDENTIFLPRDYMLDLWQAIRSFGFCTKVIIPAGIEGLWPYIYNLMSELEYLEPVEIDIRSNLSPNKQEALQLTPRVPPQVFELSEQQYSVKQVCL